MGKSKQATFGQVLAHLRTQKFDQLQRKVWSQQRLADEAGLSIKIVGDIERGRRMNIDDESLSRLANALNLGLLEQEQFYRLASRVDSHYLPPDRTLDAVLNEQLTLLEPLRVPAYVHDNLLNVVAANSMWAYLWSFTPSGHKESPLHTNLLKQFMDAEQMPRISFGPRWRSVMLRTITRFRAYSLSVRHTETYHATLSALMEIPDFAYLWQESEQQSNQFVESGYTLIQHGRIGSAMVAPMRRTVATRQGNLYVTVLLPGNSVAVRQFDKIIKRSSTGATLYPSLQTMEGP